MTTTVKLSYVNGNKALAVKLEGNSVGELGPGRSIEVSLHSGQQLTVDETGEFFGSTAQTGQQANATVDRGNTDAGEYEGRDDLPPGAGNPGASVPDERVE